MDLSSPSPTTNSPLIPVFGDNVQDMLGTATLRVSPSAIITVNSIADVVDDLNSGVTTLRDAINQANGDNGSDLIVFERSLFSNQQTITLGGTELFIYHNLEIIAPRDPLTGGDLVTVSGNKTSRVFEISSGATVNLSGLIVESGSVTGDNGGGIKNSGTLTLDSSIVRNNSADTTGNYPLILGGNGGGIYSSANLTVINSTIIGNTARANTSTSGAGIYSSGNLTVNNSTISGNLGGTGSGIFNVGGTVDVNNSSISGNSAISSSGAISNSGFMKIDNSTISNNTGVTGDGGISNSGTLNVNNSTISDNLGGVGGSGGIFNYNGTVDVNNSTISGNGGARGGGISNYGTLNVNNSTISNNGTSAAKSTGSGGGISNYGTMNVSESTISGNRASFGSGGGIYNLGTVNVSDSTISGNSASSVSNFQPTSVGRGGGIYNGGILNLVFTTITGNQAIQTGGVLNDTNSSTIVRDTMIAANLNANYGNFLGTNPDVSGTFTSNGYNLIGDNTGSTGFGTTGDIVGTSDNPIDPRLAPLDFYGGPTQTLALLPDSPAIDAGDPTVLDTDPTTDQRGLDRVSGGKADIGAFEAQV